MDLKSATLGRLSAIQHLFAIQENQESEPIGSLFKDCFSHTTRVDTSIKNKIVLGVNENKEKLNLIFSQYGQEKSSTLFRHFFNAMAFESMWMKKPTAILWSEYKQLAELFFHDKETNALKAILNQLTSE